MIEIAAIAAAVVALTAWGLLRLFRGGSEGLKRFDFDAAKSLESRGG